VKSRIGLFGGTFDPVHRGHVSIAQSYLNTNFIDSLWIIPSAFPPHKPAQITDFHHRVEMLYLAFKGNSNILINPVESTLPEPGYTIQTLEYLQLTNSENEYYWCIGFNSFYQLAQI
jgi:nicotinate-nucleotide adenylyltransferase